MKMWLLWCWTLKAIKAFIFSCHPRSRIRALSEVPPCSQQIANPLRSCKDRWVRRLKTFPSGTSESGSVSRKSRSTYDSILETSAIKILGEFELEGSVHRCSHTWGPPPSTQWVNHSWRQVWERAEPSPLYTGLRVSCRLEGTSEW